MKELISEARNLRVCANGIRDLGERLPTTDAGVLSILDSTIEVGDSEAFTALLLAALAKGWNISAAIMSRGLTLVTDPLALTSASTFGPLWPIAAQTALLSAELTVRSPLTSPSRR